MFKRLSIVNVLCIFIGINTGVTLHADNIKQSSISGQWFMQYQSGKEQGSASSHFQITRGYININNRLNDYLSGRITPDISVDRDGDGEGDLEMRLKYCFADLSLPSLWLLTESHIEMGLVHRPWLDFEEHINRYRMQGTMFLERNHLLNSGDFGITYFANLGGLIDEIYRREVNTSYPGRFGSIAVGIYNGGGYHAIELNNNKTLEGRLTLRPFHSVAPGLQFSYLGIVGKGNANISPDWSIHTLFCSLEHRRYILTGTLYSGAGDFKGTAIDDNGNALDQNGWSMFSELKSAKLPLSVIGRYDYFTIDSLPKSVTRKKIIAGVSWHIEGKTKVLIDYDIETYENWKDYNAAFVQTTLEYAF